MANCKFATDWKGNGPVDEATQRPLSPGKQGAARGPRVDNHLSMIFYFGSKIGPTNQPNHVFVAGINSFLDRIIFFILEQLLLFEQQKKLFQIKKIVLQ